MAKYAFVAYILWFIGGIMGLHLLYLRRERHAFLWVSTLGGFGLGCLRDLSRIKDYVDYANGVIRQPAYNKNLRFFAMIVLGTTLGYLVPASVPGISKLFDYLFTDTVFRIPEAPLLKLLKWCVDIAVPFFVGVGIHTVGNIEPCSTRFTFCLITAYCCYPLFYSNQNYFGVAAISSVLVVWKEMKDDKPQKKLPWNSYLCRVLMFLIASASYLTLMGSIVIHSSHVTFGDGNNVPLVDIFKQFSTSFEWSSDGFTNSSSYGRDGRNSWSRIAQRMAFFADERRAYEILDLSPYTDNPRSIKKRCRQLKLKWHPDKYKTENEKNAAQETFMKIHKACDVLHGKQHRRNKDL